ncbi:unnamed protein product, partial [Candidula unifasciata]
MQFHLTHGSAIQLTKNRTIATRSVDTFCNGIVFSDQPIKLGQKICVELASVAIWSSAVRIGVTAVDPAGVDSDQLPKFSYPALTQTEGYWVRVVNENLITERCRLTLCLTFHGQLQLLINGIHKGALLLGLATHQNLWLLLDLYGSTNSAKFVQP